MIPDVGKSRFYTFGSSLEKFLAEFNHGSIRMTVVGNSRQCRRLGRVPALKECNSIVFVNQIHSKGYYAKGVAMITSSPVVVVVVIIREWSWESMVSLSVLLLGNRLAGLEDVLFDGQR